MQTSFNLVQAGALLQQRWKPIVAGTLLAGIVAAATVFIIPQYFRSSATIVSANPALADKARLFNNNIQGLYSYFGSGDDLDRITGIADMDTTYKKLVDEFALISYYKLKGDDLPLLRRKAVLHLRDDLSFQRTEQGQLKIIAWTKKKELSANIVNRMVAIISEIETGIWDANYTQVLSNLNSSISDMEQQYRKISDSLSSMNGGDRELASVQMQTLLEQLKQYRKSADEFKLATQTKPAVLYVLESGVPAAKAERPNKLNNLLAALLLGFVFSCLLVLVSDRKTAA
jgi:uncharacterized protein involved in exopolysaccharide biosynthesis